MQKMKMITRFGEDAGGELGDGGEEGSKILKHSCKIPGSGREGQF